MELKPGDTFGDRYQILSKPGKSGMGEVWNARDPQLGRDVAIKASAQQSKDPFELEACAIAQNAAALEAAHDKIIAHRDLKPAQVEIRPDRSVKVLDPAHVGAKRWHCFHSPGRGVNMEIPAKGVRAAEALAQRCRTMAIGEAQ
jgi:hypothetical protein